MVVTTDFICGQAGCAAIGMGLVAAIMLLVAIGWFYELCSSGRINIWKE